MSKTDECAFNVHEKCPRPTCTCICHEGELDVNTPTHDSSSPEQEEPKRYELRTADLLAIPEDRFDDFIVDLKKWHSAARTTIDMINDIASAVGEPNVPAELVKMVWIDDGKHDGEIIIKSREATEVIQND